MLDDYRTKRIQHPPTLEEAIAAWQVISRLPPPPRGRARGFYEEAYDDMSVAFRIAIQPLLLRHA